MRLWKDLNDKRLGDVGSFFKGSPERRVLLHHPKRIKDRRHLEKQHPDIQLI